MATTEKSTFTKPISAAIGKATGVFARPKLQRRANTAYSPGELISALRLSHHMLDPTEDHLGDCPTFSPCLSTWEELGSNFMKFNSTTDVKQNHQRVRSNSDTMIESQLNKNLAPKNPVKNDFSIQCLQVKEIITDTLTAHLWNMKYSHGDCGEKGRVISQSIEKRVKELNTKLYKVMVLVYVGALRDQGIELSCQCSWTPGSDVFAMDSYRNETVFASGIVFATLYE